MSRKKNKEFKIGEIVVYPKHGVGEIKRIESLEAKFDPELHQAMMEVEDEDIDEGIVVQEIQAGYTMHERLLRPAMVGVSKKPSAEINKEADKSADIDDDKKNIKTKNK